MNVCRWVCILVTSSWTREIIRLICCGTIHVSLLRCWSQRLFFLWQCVELCNLIVGLDSRMGTSLSPIALTHCLFIYHLRSFWCMKHLREPFHECLIWRWRICRERMPRPAQVPLSHASPSTLVSQAMLPLQGRYGRVHARQPHQRHS